VRIDIYLAVKYIASACTAGYGIYATLNDFHEQKNGQRVLTKKGYIGIAFLIASTFLSFSSDVTKDIKEKKASADEQKHREEITKNMNDELQKTGAISTTLQGSLESQNKAFGVITTNLQSEVTQTQTVKAGLDRSLDAQTKLLQAQQQLAEKSKALQLQVIRPYYPLNPVTISYEVDFPMASRWRRGAEYIDTFAGCTGQMGKRR
jgi:ribosomal protein L17